MTKRSRRKTHCLSALVAVVVVLSAVATPGTAAGQEATLTIGSTTVSPGATGVTLPVSLTTPRPLSFLRFDVTFSGTLCGVARERGTDTTITGVVVGADASVAAGKDLVIQKTTSVSQSPQEEVFPCNGGHIPIAVFDLTGGSVIAAGTATIFRIELDVRGDATAGNHTLALASIQAKDGPVTVAVTGQGGTLTIKPPVEPARCGDGVIDPGEQCDDGNTEGGDGCSATCTVERPLDTVFCYAARPTRGMLCAAEAGPRAGTSCEEEEDCGGISEAAAADLAADVEAAVAIEATSLCVPNKFPTGLRVGLADRLETGVRIFDVKKPVNLCAPADLNGKGVSDGETHLHGYQVALTKGRCAAGAPANAGEGCTKEPDCGGGKGTKHCVTQALPVPRKDLQVTDAFHPATAPLRVNAEKPDRLLVPTAKGLTTPVGLPGLDSEVDHYKCYGVTAPRGTPRFVPIPAVGIDDQFTAGVRVFSLNKPTRVCVPVDKDEEGIKDPQTGLMCYQAVAVKGLCAVGAPANPGGVCGKEQECGGGRGTGFCLIQPVFKKALGVYVSNQFGQSQVDTSKEEEVCVPSRLLGLEP